MRGWCQEREPEGEREGTEEDERPECKRDEFICLVAFPYDPEAIDRAEDAGEAGAVCINLSRKHEEGNLKCWGGLQDTRRKDYGDAELSLERHLQG